MDYHFTDTLIQCWKNSKKTEGEHLVSHWIIKLLSQQVNLLTWYCLLGYLMHNRDFRFVCFHVVKRPEFCGNVDFAWEKNEGTKK